jgi:ATP-binding cassette subfamily A (ABC1) protein 5
MIIPVPSDATVIDSFAEIIRSVLPLFVILIYLLPVYNTVFLIVKEKESRTRESCKMMGMSDTPYWLSWFVFYTIQNTIISLIAWGVLCINVIEYSSKGYVFAYFWLFGESVFGQIVLLAALF